jgi:hypothetical protein
MSLETAFSAGTPIAASKMPITPATYPAMPAGNPSFNFRWNPAKRRELDQLCLRLGITPAEFVRTRVEAAMWGEMQAQCTHVGEIPIARNHEGPKPPLLSDRFAPPPPHQTQAPPRQIAPRPQIQNTTTRLPNSPWASASTQPQQSRPAIPTGGFRDRLALPGLRNLPAPKR